MPKAPALATGIKMANPEMKPLIFMGDGDALSIGLGHFLHLCRRNLDCIVLVFNNHGMSMTGGQMSLSTSIPDSYTATSPLGAYENQLDAVKIAIEAGATYVARTTVAHPRGFMKYFKKALKHKGTTVIEICTICPTFYGRKNLDTVGIPNAEGGKKMDTGGKMINYLMERSVRINQAKLMSEKELRYHYVIGEFYHNTDKLEYSEVYRRIQEKMMKRT